MTAAEKAKEILEKFTDEISSDDYSGEEKKFAIICVNEILVAVENLKLIANNNNNSCLIVETEYWQAVKQELISL